MLLLLPGAARAEDSDLLETSRELMKGTSYYGALTTLDPLLLRKDRADQR